MTDGDGDGAVNDSASQLRVVDVTDGDGDGRDDGHGDSEVDLNPHPDPNPNPDPDPDDDSRDGGDSNGEVGLAAKLRQAAQQGDHEALAKALASSAATPALVNAADDGGITPLHTAARAGSAACVRALLEARADGDKESRKGNRPLAVACKHSQWAAAGALLDGGAGVDAIAMLQAVRHEAGERLQSRLWYPDRGSSPDPADGRSPLLSSPLLSSPLKSPLLESL